MHMVTDTIAHMDETLDSLEGVNEHEDIRSARKELYIRNQVGAVPMPLLERWLAQGLGRSCNVFKTVFALK